MIIEKGCRFSWYFHYMPVGNEAAVELLPSMEQRRYMHQRIREIRGKTGGKEIFAMDFQNDGEFVGGCIAGGRNYCHITVSYTHLLLAGRYPQNDQEILIPEHLSSNGGISWKLGDEITMEFGSRIGIAPDGEEEPLEAEDPYYGLNNEEGVEYKERLTDTKERTYRVVGIVKRPPFESRYQAGYSAVTILTPEIMAESSDVELYMLVKKVTPGIYDWIEGELTEDGLIHRAILPMGEIHKESEPWMTKGYKGDDFALRIPSPMSIICYYLRCV